MKKIVLFLVLLIAHTTLFAVTISVSEPNNPPLTFTVDNITYTVSGAEASVVGNSITTLPNISIPSTVTNGGTTYNVTSIGDNAFFQASLTNITIPNSVTSIGYQAFAVCSNLTSITLPTSVTSIGSFAFIHCTSLTSITLPNTLTSIGYNAFDGCTSLTSITLPNTLTSIKDYVFLACYNLTSITIPNNLTSIGLAAFAFCHGLTSITLPNNLTSIGPIAFTGCTGLVSLTINADTPPIISANVFTGVTVGSVKLYVPAGSLTDYRNASIWSGFKFAPVITGPGPSTASASSLSMNENSTAVTTFNADETVNWSLGTSNDGALFSINSSGVLVFNAAPDYETPLSQLNNNTYIVDIIATGTVSVLVTSQQLTITITNVADSPAVLSNFNSFTVSVGDSEFIINAPTSDSTGAITYTSSNPAVATITGTTVHLVGPGTTTITATQAADGSHSGNSISTTMRVSALCGDWGYSLTYPPTTITIIPN